MKRDLIEEALERLEMLTAKVPTSVLLILLGLALGFWNMTCHGALE